MKLCFELQSFFFLDHIANSTVECLETGIDLADATVHFFEFFSLTVFFRYI